MSDWQACNFKRGEKLFKRGDKSRGYETSPGGGVDVITGA